MAAELSTEDLERAAGGIEYRVTQMIEALDYLAYRSFIPDPADRFALKTPAILNALIESVLVNARVLAYFLSKRKGGEVTACDFLPTWEPRPGLGWIIGDVSKHLTHAKHVEPPAPWELGRIARPLVDGLREFVAELRVHTPDRAAWFENAIEEAHDRLGYGPGEEPDDPDA